MRPDDVFGIWIHDESMSPRYFPGELITVHPNKPVPVGDYAVVQKDDDELLIRQFLGRKNGKVHLKQFNPLRTITIPESRVKHIYLILARIERAAFREELLKRRSVEERPSNGG